jgi:hypothetical protein
MSQRQRLALVLCAALTWTLAMPFFDDLPHGSQAWWGDLPFLVIAISVASGMLAAVLDPDGSRTTALDVVRRRAFWVGVALIPVAWFVPAFLA